MSETQAKIFGISRHRLATDGEGITTLVTFHGCPLRCAFCLNPQSLGDGSRFRDYTPAGLYETVRIDELYFLSTGGGITFGGGEPALHPKFITEFRAVCGPAWKINIETSLNVPEENVRALLPVVDFFMIDIKDMDPSIYAEYTGQLNDRVISNLRLIAAEGRQADCLIRLPLIPYFNTEADRTRSRALLTTLGYTRFDEFTYMIKNH